MPPGLENLSGEVLAALFNGTYQGIAVVVVVLVYLRWNRSNNATTRHAILLATLAVVTLLPMAHLVAEWCLKSETQLEGRVARPSTRELVTVEEAVASPLNPKVVPKAHRSHPRAKVHQAPLILQTEVEGSLKEGTSTPTLAFEAVPDIRAGGDTVSPQATFPKPVETRLRSAAATSPGQNPKLLKLAPPVRWFARGWPKRFAPMALGVWLIVTGALLTRLAWQFGLLTALKQRSRPAGMDLAALFGELCASMGIRRKPRLLICDAIQVPLAAGFTKPAVLLPVDLAEHPSMEALRPLLRHELAHLARRDDWANLGQLLAQSVFFFHPGVWWLSRRLSVEREIACDDRVLEAKEASRAYALLLTEFVHRCSARRWVAASAAWSHKSQLKERIDMILNSQRNTSPLLARTRVGALTTCAVVLALVGLRVGPRVALGDALPTPATDPTPTSSSQNTPESAPSAIISAKPEVRTVTLTSVTGKPATSEIARVDAVAPIAEVESGPRSKPSVDNLPTPPAAPVPAAIPAPGSAPLALPVDVSVPLATTVTVDSTGTTIRSVSGSDVNPPVPPRDPFRGGHRNADGLTENSLESRMQRLEKMLHELLNRDHLMPEKGLDAAMADMEAQQEKQRAKLEAQLDEIQSRRDAAQAQREAAEAAKEAVREARQAQREAMKEAEQARREAEQAQREAAAEAKAAAEEAAQEAKAAEEEARQAKLEAEREARDNAEAKAGQDLVSKGGGSEDPSALTRGKGELSDSSDVAKLRHDLIREQKDLQRRLADIERRLSHLDRGDLRKQ